MKNSYMENMDSSEHVILINYTGRKGGGALDSYEITKALIENGNKVVAVVSHALENLEDWEKLNLEKLVVIRTYDGMVSFVTNSLTFGLKQRKRIRLELKGFNIKTIYCPMDTLWSRKVSKCFKNAKIITAIHDPKAHEGAHLLERLIFHFHAKFSQVLIVHTKKFVEYVQKKYKKQTYYIPLGRHNLYRNCNNKKQLISYEKEKANFVFFGRITPYKGLDTLAEAYKIVANKLGDKVSLTICGNGDFSSYEALYDELPNTRIINQWIYDEEVESIFTGENLISVCPYKEATQSGVVLVSLDYGVPVIATKTGGLDEQISEGKTGYLVSPNNILELSEAMIHLAEDKQLREEMSQNALKEIEMLSWNKSAEILARIVAENERK